MNERQPIPVYEWKNSRSPADADLMVLPERELGAFHQSGYGVVRSTAGKACGRGLGRRTGVDGCFAWTDQARMGIGHRRCLSPACKAAEYRRGPSNATRCVD
jgi:hypothetical protein